MNQLELQRRVVEVFEQLGIRYFVTGSIASIFFGEPRFTNDIDIVAEVEASHVAQLITLFPEDEFYVSADAIRHAIQHRTQFNIIHPTSGLKVDVMIPKQDELDRSRFERRLRIRPAPDFEVYYTSPEDLILKKLEYYEQGGSEKHLRDIAGILKSGRVQVDREYVTAWARRKGWDDVWEQILSQL
jgi:hypothetical protein